MNNIQTIQFPEKALKYVVEREKRRIQNMRLSVLSYAPLALAAVAGYIRHHLTEYDYLLADGRTRDRARNEVRAKIQDFEIQWGRS